MRHSYRVFRERVGRLANGLARLGVKAGDTVAVMDWDSHRYLECMFAVPMMGATLHTINVRLSPEQILYTMNHARDDVVLVNSEFVPMLENDCWASRQGCENPRWIDELPAKSRRRCCRSSASTRSCWPAASPLRLPGLRRKLGRDDVLHHRHHRPPQGRVFHPPATGAAHHGRVAIAITAAVTACWHPTTCTCRSRRCSTCTPGACRMWRPCWASSRSIPAATPRSPGGAVAQGEGHVLPLRADHPADGPPCQGGAEHDSVAGKSSSAAPRCRGAGRGGHEPGIDVYRRLRHVGNLPVLTLAQLQPQAKPWIWIDELELRIKAGTSDAAGGAAHRRCAR